MPDLPDSVVNISIYGSWVRGDHDEYSDFDVIVAVRDGSGKTTEEGIIEFVSSLYGSSPSISWYGISKINNMFTQGDLFAWHLFLESKSVGAYPTLESIFGKPSKYDTAAADISELSDILDGVSCELAKAPGNAVFEMGIIYVCARNIAMSGSSKLCSVPDFGRYSPFTLPIPFPITKNEYDVAMYCRMASQRGLTPPVVTVGDVVDTQRKLISWSKLVLQEVTRVVAA